jgi:predicted transglutaminase-like cysteine proteinase
MLNNTKTIALAAIAWISAFGLAEAKFDDFVPSSAGAPIFRHLLNAADLSVIRLSVASIDPINTASLPGQTDLDAPAPSAKPNYNVFRSVVVPVGKMQAFAQWSKVRPSAGTVSDFCAGAFCDSNAGRRIAAAAETARDLAPVEALRLVNRTVNTAIKYRSDSADTWQTLAQSAARGAGDCEDYAIAKMELLAELGFSPDQLQFVVLRNTRTQIYHAVLAVHVGGTRYILDNLSNTVASDDIFRTYVPIVSFVGEKRFVHGFKGKSTGVAMGKGGLAGIRLGEGS